MEKTFVSSEDLTTTGKLLKDALASIILLAGAFAVEYGKKQFGPDGPPQLTRYILNISEMTLFLSFLVALIRVATILFNDFNRLITTIRQSGLGNSIKAFRFGQPTRKTILNSLALGLLAGILIGLSGLIIFAFSQIPTTLLVIGIIVMGVYIVASFVYVTRDAGPWGNVASFGGGAIGCLLVIGFIATVFSIIALLLQKTGNTDSFITLLRNLLNRG